MEDEREELTFEDGYAELHNRDLISLLDDKLDPEVEDRKRKHLKEYVEQGIRERKDIMDNTIKEKEIEVKKAELKIKKKELKIKEKDSELRERELDLKESSQKLDTVKVGLSIATAVLSLAELALVIYTTKDYQVTDYMMQEEGFMPGKLGKTGQMLLDTELRNNLPK